MHYVEYNNSQGGMILEAPFIISIAVTIVFLLELAFSFGLKGEQGTVRMLFTFWVSVIGMLTTIITMITSFTK